ncbi:benzoyl-CoA reductase, bzd-type, subunit Q, partial [bacterium]|nr:benzoyl-CoA reductase, bzd-type, subunit Q [bacterium]
TKEKVLAAYCLAMAIRITKLLERIKLKPDFAITGGIAKNSGVVRRVERLTGIKALEPSLDTQIAGALGAALIAAESLTKSQLKCAGD